MSWNLRGRVHGAGVRDLGFGCALVVIGIYGSRLRVQGAGFQACLGRVDADKFGGGVLARNLAYVLVHDFAPHKVLVEKVNHHSLRGCYLRGEAG